MTQLLPRSLRPLLLLLVLSVQLPLWLLALLLGILLLLRILLLLMFLQLLLLLSMLLQRLVLLVVAHKRLLSLQDLLLLQRPPSQQPCVLQVCPCRMDGRRTLQRGSRGATLGACWRGPGAVRI